MSEHIVTVKFVVKENLLEGFIAEVIINSRESLNESGCKRFDISVKGNTVFLYEVYCNEEAFYKHLDTKHFKDFNESTTNYVISKRVESYEGLDILI